jgi:hypothetical protein
MVELKGQLIREGISGKMRRELCHGESRKEKERKELDR